MGVWAAAWYGGTHRRLRERVGGGRAFGREGGEGVAPSDGCRREGREKVNGLVVLWQFFVFNCLFASIVSFLLICIFPVLAFDCLGLDACILVFILFFLLVYL